MNANLPPEVTVLVPVRNEEQFLAKCIDSIVSQHYPKERLEILIIDGESEDRTPEIAYQLAQAHRNIRVVKNNGRIIPIALNTGIALARGDIILRADAHTSYDPDYIKTSVENLVTSKASNVGGVIAPVSANPVGKTIACAVSSPFGVGNAYYRFAKRKMWVDTVAFGCWRKKTLSELGGYKEDYLINEDYELNYRLRSSGGTILLSPEIRCQYFCRSSLKSLFNQYFRYGKWKVKMLKQHPESLVPRQLVPPLFVLGLVGSICLIPCSLLPIQLLLIPYLLVSMLFCGRIFIRDKAPARLLLPVFFFAIHFAWGSGFLQGLRTFGIPRLFAFRNGKRRPSVNNQFGAEDRRKYFRQEARFLGKCSLISVHPKVTTSIRVENFSIAGIGFKPANHVNLKKYDILMLKFDIDADPARPIERIAIVQHASDHYVGAKFLDIDHSTLTSLLGRDSEAVPN